MKGGNKPDKPDNPGNGDSDDDFIELTEFGESADTGDGMDTVVASAGGHTIDTGADDDTIILESGGNIVEGGDGIDVVRFFGDSLDLSAGTTSNGDIISGVENVWGGETDQTLSGDDGANSIKGFRGDDLLNGNGGDDELIGGGGNDTLNGGSGSDVLHGGRGNDTFLFTGDGVFGDIDTIDDYDPRKDTIELSGVGVDDISDDGSNTTLSLSDGSQVVVLGEVLTESDLVFS